MVLLFVASKVIYTFLRFLITCRKITIRSDKLNSTWSLSQVYCKSMEMKVIFTGGAKNL